jgi:DNA end-binding protein Ku
MAAHAAFQGFLRISLVSVPVKAFNASQPGAGQISFHQLHDECHRRIQYKKFCPVHGQVSMDEIVSGYEYEKGKYVVVDPGELEKLRTERDRAIDIQKFVRFSQVDPLSPSGKDYFLLPDGAMGQKPYQLIHKAMESADVCGIAQVVLSKREELVMVHPVDKLLVMTVLKYAHQLKNPENFSSELAEAKASKQEQELTTQLIKALTEKSFHLAAYHDKYEERLKELIDAKIEGKEIVAPPETPAEPQVINLMDAIRKSMKQIKPVAEEKKPSRKRRGASERPLPAAARRKKSG